MPRFLKTLNTNPKTTHTKCKTLYTSCKRQICFQNSVMSPQKGTLSSNEIGRAHDGSSDLKTLNTNPKTTHTKCKTLYTSCKRQICFQNSVMSPQKGTLFSNDTHSPLYEDRKS